MHFNGFSNANTISTKNLYCIHVPNATNINQVNKASINSDENSNKTLYITFAIILILLIIGGFFVVKYQKTDITNEEINSTGVVEFNQTEFADRNEELKYIREYFNQKFPDYAIKMIPPEHLYLLYTKVDCWHHSIALDLLLY